MGDKRISNFGIMFVAILLVALVRPADAFDLVMNGAVNITGGVSATSFAGDGAQLTNVPASGSVSISNTPDVNIANVTVPVSGTVSLSGTPNVNISGTSNPIPISGSVQSSSLTTTLVTHLGTDTDYYHDMDASHCSTVRVTVNSVIPGSGSFNILLYNMDLPGYGVFLSNDSMTSASNIYTKVLETPGVNIRIEIMNYSNYEYMLIVNCRP